LARIVAFTLNPSIDLSTSVDWVRPDHKLRCEQPEMFPGGGAVNVARVISRLGADVELIYPAGGATGLLLRRLIDAEGIPNLAIQLEAETREDLTVREKATGAEYRFVFPGAPLDAEALDACLRALAAASFRPSFIIASGSLPPGVPTDVLARIARKARATKTRFVVDTSGAALASVLQEGVYLVKPNLRELRQLLGPIDDDPASLAEAASGLIDRGQARIVALSLGARGAIIVTPDQAWVAHAPEVKLVSTVGAGDSFLGGLVWALDAGLSVREAFRYGVAAGAAAVQMPGTALARKDEIERLLPASSIELLRVRRASGTIERVRAGES
jgi:6-phosphofructokinase 2